MAGVCFILVPHFFFESSGVAMDAISRFNPYTMSEEQVLNLQTAHETDLNKILSVIQNNQKPLTSKHIVICGPGGIGKSFLLRRLQIHFKPYKTINFILFPEIPSHMYCANDFLIKIKQSLLYENDTVKISAPDTNIWQKNIQILDQLIEKSDYNHMIIGIENLHLMLSDHGIFSHPKQKEKLQDLLQNKSWLTLITTHRSIPTDVSPPLFESFYKYHLSEWTELDHENYLNTIFKIYQRSRTEHPTIKKNALYHFTGGMPRNAVIMADIIRHKDIQTIINALEETIDWLTPYFQNQFLSLMPQLRLLIDGLICGKEPCTISELANRVQLDETEISQNVLWLVNHGYLNSHIKENNSTTYFVKDRLFVQYYRMRHGGSPIENNKKKLSTLSDFLTTFYDHADLNKIAQDYYTQGNIILAKELLHIILTHAKFSIDLLPWKEDPALLFQAIEICFSPNFQLPTSEKKGAIIHQQIRILLEASQYLPKFFDIKRFACEITGHLFINEKISRFLFQKCINNQITYNQWLDLDLFFIRQEYKMRMAYGDFLMPLVSQLQHDEIIPDLIREARINRIKQSAPGIYHALVAFCHERFPFEISSTNQLEAHRACLAMTKNSEFQVFHLEQIGWHCGCLKAYNESIQYFQKALTIRKKQNNLLKQAWILGQIGWCYQLLKQYDISLKNHEKACMIYDDANEYIHCAWNIGCMGRIHGKLGHYEAALEKHQEAIALLEKYPDIKLTAWNWSRIARNQTCLKCYDLAMDSHQTALELLKIENDNDLQAWNLEGLAWIYGKVNQHDDAIKTQQQALKLRSQEGNISQQAWNLEGIGWSLGKLGRFEEAIKVLNRALKVRERSNNQKGQAWNLEGIARYLGNLERFDEAIAAHKRALVFQNKENNYERQIWNHRGIAWNYKKMSEYDKSLHTLKQALDCAEKSKNIYWQASIWALIGWNLHQKHCMSDSIKAHEMAVSLYKELKNGAGVLENAGQMAINYFILGQTGRAWNVLDHYGASSQCPNKMIVRLGEVVIYLIRNVRHNIAYRTAINIIDGLLLRHQQWNISPALQAFLLLLMMANLDINFIHRLARYIKKQYQWDSNNQFQAVIDLVEYVHQGGHVDYLNQLDSNRRLRVESLINAIGDRWKLGKKRGRL